jgi:hypothetical protein
VVQSARLLVEDQDEVTLGEACQGMRPEAWGVQSPRGFKGFQTPDGCKTVIGDKISTIPKLPMPDPAEIPGVERAQVPENVSIRRWRSA